MRTVSYAEIIRSACDKIGLSLASLNDPDWLRFRGWANKRLGEAWEADFWPELMRLEQRWYKAAYNAATAYTNDGTIIYFYQTQQYYLALKAARLAVTSITRSGTTATVTTTAAHLLVTGQQMTISGAVETDYNITATVTVTGASTFTYTVANSPTTPATGTIYCGVNPADSNAVTQQVYWALAQASYAMNVWLATNTYAVGDIVYYAPGNVWYQCHTASAAGVLPTNTTYWGRLYALDRVIPYEQTGYDSIGQAVECYTANNYVYRNGEPVLFSLSQNGVQIERAVPYVFLHYRLRPPALTGDDWVSGTSYAIGDQVYYDTGVAGNFYDCIQATSSLAPTDTAYWEVVELPYIFSRYLPQAMYADWLADGQNDKYVLEEQKAMLLLDSQHMLLFGQQQNYKRINLNC